MENLRDEGKARLARATVGATITIALLLTLRTVVSVLPLFHTYAFAQYSPVTLDELIAALLSFLVALSIVNYGFQVDISAKLMSQRFPAVGTLMRLLICGGAVVYAYFALRHAALACMEGFESAYTTAFGVLIGLVLLGIVASVFRNGDVIARATISLLSHPGPPPDGRVCSECGKAAPRTAEFCRSCGGKVIERMPGPGRQCSSCHQAVAVGDQFCRSCGAKIRVEDAVSNKEQETTTPEETVCWSCVNPVSREDRFCRSCGADQTALKPSIESLSEKSPADPKRRLCSSCEKPADERDRFCRACGARVAPPDGRAPDAAPTPGLCPSCRKPVTDDADQYCRSCGASIVAGGLESAQP